MELDTTLLLHPFNGLFSRQAWVSRYRKGKTSLDLTEVRDDGVLGCSGISWTICKQSAPHSRQITSPTPCHSIFTGRMLFLMPNQQCQSTEGSNNNTTTDSNTASPTWTTTTTASAATISTMNRSQPRRVMMKPQLNYIHKAQHGHEISDNKWWK